MSSYIEAITEGNIHKHKLVVVYGNSEELITNIDVLLGAELSKLAYEVNRIDISEQKNINDLRFSLNTQSFFEQQGYTIIKFDKPILSITDQLISYISNSKHRISIFISKLKHKDRNHEGFIKLLKNSFSIRCDNPTFYQWINFIKLKLEHMHISQKSLAHIALTFSNNKLINHINELEKLSLLSTDNRLSDDDVFALMSYNYLPSLHNIAKHYENSNISAFLKEMRLSIEKYSINLVIWKLENIFLHSDNKKQANHILFACYKARIALKTEGQNIAELELISMCQDIR